MEPRCRLVHRMARRICVLGWKFLSKDTYDTKVLGRLRKGTRDGPRWSSSTVSHTGGRRTSTGPRYLSCRRTYRLKLDHYRIVDHWSGTTTTRNGDATTSRH